MRLTHKRCAKRRVGWCAWELIRRENTRHRAGFTAHIWGGFPLGVGDMVGVGAEPEFDVPIRLTEAQRAMLNARSDPGRLPLLHIDVAMECVDPRSGQVASAALTLSWPKNAVPLRF